MRHLIYALPYVAIYFIAALLFYKHDQYWQYFFILIITVSLIYAVNLIIPKLMHAYDNKNKFLFSSNNKSIEDFKIPSTVIYRIRKNYDISLEDIQNVENELKNIFNKAYQDISKGKSPKNICDKAQPLTYLIWNELYKSGEIYNKFCTKALGKTLLPPFQKIKEIENSFILENSPAN